MLRYRFAALHGQAAVRRQQPMLGTGQKKTVTNVFRNEAFVTVFCMQRLLFEHKQYTAASGQLQLAAIYAAIAAI